LLKFNNNNVAFKIVNFFTKYKKAHKFLSLHAMKSQVLTSCHAIQRFNMLACDLVLIVTFIVSLLYLYYLN
jgi:hypothetical protein